MKTKNKIVAMVEIAIVLCSVFLVAIPAIAADQNQEMQKASTSEVTTASEDDYVLGIYGNANEDGTIDMGDVVYTKLAIFGKKSKTELCDAKYDGRINVLDVIQTKLIILGKEKELTIVDSYGEAVTVNKPVKRIVAGYNDRAELLRILDAKDRVVAIDKSIKTQPTYFPELSKLSSIGYAAGYGQWDYEAILGLNPDVFMPLGKGQYHELEQKLPGVTIICLNLREDFVESTKKLGYILEKKYEAEEFIDWYEGYMDKIKSRTEELSEDEKPRVFIERWDYRALPKELMCDIAGGRNVAAGLKGKPPSGTVLVDPEFVIAKNPEFIIRYVSTPSIVGYEIDDQSEAIALSESILNRPELANVHAVKNENVYVIDVRHFGLTGGAGVVISTAYYAKWFHPDIFEDLDPQAIHQEYVTQFQRIDFNVYEHGVFVYPEEPVS